MSMQETIPSPLSSGGAGTTFEHHVGAMFLALLLTRGVPAVFRNCQVEEVSFQTRHLGWETDDLLITCSTENQEKRQLAIQAKRSFTVGTSSEDCKQTFEGFWGDFKAVERFNPQRDALVLTTLHGTSTLMNGLGGLLECARNSSSAEDFAHRLSSPGLLSNKAKNCLLVIKSIVAAKFGPSGIDDAEFWRFLKAVHILALDLTTSSAQQEAVVKQLLAQSAGGSDAMTVAETTWYELLEIAATSASGAKTLSRPDLPDAMLGRHTPVEPPWSALQALREHSHIVLEVIRSNIAGAVTLPRRATITPAVEALADNQVVVLTGSAGSGKSALAKAVVEQQASDYVCLSFRAEEFAQSHIDQVLHGTITGQQLSILIGTQEKVLVHVESLERLLEHPTRDAFTDLVGIVKRCPNLRLLLTCRDYSIATALAAFFDQNRLTRVVVDVPALKEEELTEVMSALPGLAIPMADPALKRLLRIPYFLDMAATLDWSGQQAMPSDERTFREKCWDAVVRKNSLSAAALPDRREQALLELSLRRARELRPFVPTEGIDAEALGALQKDGIVFQETGGLAAPAHDVVEDWSIVKWLESLAAKHEWDATEIAEAVGPHPAMRRGFREWLKEALVIDRTRADQFVLSAYRNNSLPQHFRDDVLVSMLHSDSAGDFILRQKGQLLANDAELLVRLIHLTRVACKKTPKWLHDLIAPPSVLLEPEGEAWPFLLETVAGELDHLLPEYLGPILGLLEDWSQGASTECPTPDGTIPAGRVAYGLLEQTGGFRNDDLRKRVLKAIARVPSANPERFHDILGRASERSEKRDMMLEEFSDLLIDGIDGIPACRDFPDQMAQLTMSWCCLSEEDLERASRFGGGFRDIEPEFGIHPNRHFTFFPPSAIRGPFLPLLRFHPSIGVKLILDLVNHAGDWYGSRKWFDPMLEVAHSITITIDGHGVVDQWANSRLWQAYRGTSVAPYVIKSALMALESWLLEMCEASIDVEPWLLKVLKESNNVMTTAVVASVCNAHPSLAGVAALALLTCRDLIDLDRRRMIAEGDSHALTAFPRLDQTQKVYDDERGRSNGLGHRQHDLEALACKLQFRGKSEQVWKIIDAYRATIPAAGERTEEDRVWALALHRMDVRDWEAEPILATSEGTDTDGEDGSESTITFKITGMDADIQQFTEAGAQANQQFFAAMSLMNRGLHRWKSNAPDEDSDSWQVDLALARELEREQLPSGSGMLLENGPGIVAAVCVRDYWEEMDADGRQWCLDTLIASVEKDSDSQDYFTVVSKSSMDADRYAAHVLPKALAYIPDDTAVMEAVAKSVTHTSAEVSMWASEGVAEYLGSGHRDLVLRSVGAVAMYANLATEYEKSQLRKGISAPPGQPPDLLLALKRVRDAFIQGSINTDQELSILDLTSWDGRYASTRILSMLGKAPDLILAKSQFTEAGKVVVNRWAAKSAKTEVDSDFDFEQSTLSRLAGFVLALDSSEALLCCQPFLDAVQEHPDEVARFVENLIMEEDKRFPDETCFWEIWQAFADRIVETPWALDVHSKHSIGMELIDKMLFKTYWKEGLRSWDHLHGHELRVSEFATCLPPSSPVLLNFAYYLYKVGGGALPDAFTVVADRLRAGNPRELLSDGNSVFYLESLLQRYVYGQPLRLKANPELRTATLLVLDHLVDAGSSSAYMMRDDLVTPNSGTSRSPG